MEKARLKLERPRLDKNRLEKPRQLYENWSVLRGQIRNAWQTDGSPRQLLNPVGMQTPVSLA